MANKKETLAPLTKEEGEAINAELTVIMDKYNYVFVALPYIEMDGRIMAKVDVYKKFSLEETAPEEPTTPTE